MTAHRSRPSKLPDLATHYTAVEPQLLEKGARTLCGKYARQCGSVTAAKAWVTCRECLKLLGV